MFPGNMNPRQMKGLMKQFGIKSQELNAEKVIIELENGEKLIFEKPSAMLIDMKGQKTLTITGEFKKENTAEETIKEEDIKIVMEQSNESQEKARKALEESNGDIAEAIMKLKKEKE